MSARQVCKQDAAGRVQWSVFIDRPHPAVWTNVKVAAATVLHAELADTKTSCCAAKQAAWQVIVFFHTALQCLLLPAQLQNPAIASFLRWPLHSKPSIKYQSSLT